MDSTNAAGRAADSPAAEPRILVSLATYNEAGNVAALIGEIHKFVPHADVLVIDDNSPDGTWKIVEELGAADPRIKLLQRPGKLGLGTALLAAMKYAMEHDYDYLQNMDADFSHPPRYLPGHPGGDEQVRRDDRLAVRRGAAGRRTGRCRGA